MKILTMTEPNCSTSPPKSSSKGGYLIALYDKRGQIVHAYRVCDKHASNDHNFKAYLERPVGTERIPQPGGGFATVKAYPEVSCDECLPEDYI